ncbi:hypothetical protein AKJ16_DCAP09537 [Drosera capensis]
MDVKTAFLNEELTEEINMNQTERFVMKGFKKKSSNSDKCLYYCLMSNKVIIISLYVDGILILGFDLFVVKDVEQSLAKEFTMKDMGVVGTDYS